MKYLSKIKRAAWEGRIPLLSRNLVKRIWGIVRHKTLSSNQNSKKLWDNILRSKGESWRDDHYHEILDFFPKDLDFSLLDIGCAIGDGPEFLAKQFPKARIAGADFSTEGIKTAKSRGSSVEYFVLDVLTDQIPDNYDYLILVETLEHFDQPFAILEKCLRAAIKEVIISVPLSETNGPIKDVGQHRWAFDENSFNEYPILKKHVTDYIQETQSRCIVVSISAEEY